MKEVKGLDRMQGTQRVESIAPSVAERMISEYEERGNEAVQGSLTSDYLPIQYASNLINHEISRRGFSHERVSVLPYEQNGNSDLTIDLDEF